MIEKPYTVQHDSNWSVLMENRDLLSWEWPAQYPDSGETDSPATRFVGTSSEIQNVY